MGSWHSDPGVQAYIEERLKRGIYRGIGEFRLGAADASGPTVKRIAELAGERDLFMQAHVDDVAIERLLTLYRDMDKALASHAWLAGDAYSIADAAFTPYVVRLEHLDVMGLLDRTPRTADWYRGIKARPSFQAAIVRWENDKYLELMKRQGRENWLKIKEIMASC